MEIIKYHVYYECKIIYVQYRFLSLFFLSCFALMWLVAISTNISVYVDKIHYINNSSNFIKFIFSFLPVIHHNIKPPTSQVFAHLPQRRPQKTREEILGELSWCVKDAEYTSFTCVICNWLQFISLFNICNGCICNILPHLQLYW